MAEFLVISAMNLGLVAGAAFLLPSINGSINLDNALFMVLLLTLNITLTTATDGSIGSPSRSAILLSGILWPVDT